MKPASRHREPEGQRAFNLICLGLVAAVALGAARAERPHDPSERSFPAAGAGVEAR